MFQKDSPQTPRLSLSGDSSPARANSRAAISEQNLFQTEPFNAEKYSLRALKAISYKYPSILSHYPPFKKEEELKLIQLYQLTKSERALLSLLFSNLRLVYFMINKYAEPNANFEDYIQESVVAFYLGLENFSISKGAPWRSYLFSALKNALLRYRNREDRLIPIKVLGRDKANRRLLSFLLEEKRAQPESFGTELWLEEFAQKNPAFPPQKTKEFVNYLSRGRHISLDEPLSDKKGAARLSDFIPGEKNVEEAIAIAIDMRSAREWALEELKGRNEIYKAIIKENIFSPDPVSLAELGRRYNRSRERVRILRNKILAKIENQFIGQNP